MSVFNLSLKSLANRKTTTALTLFSITLSVTLLLGVEKIRQGARESFENTITGADLIVGARSGPVQLLLYSIFRIGNPTNNVSWQSFRDIAAKPEVKWAIPLSLGDSHRGFRVVGTNDQYFAHYRYGQDHLLAFAEGKPFADLYDAVIGAEVADKLGYHVGQKIVLSHGVSEVALQEHGDKPFTVTGILNRTGTPVDRSVHVGLEAVEAIHLDWQDGGPPMPGSEVSAEAARRQALTPKSISAFILGLQSRFGIFQLQRAITDYEEEPLLAILPGAAFQELWGTVGMAEVALRAISLFVVLAGLLGMLTTIMTGLNERRREMAILRSVGAKPRDVFFLMVGEALFIAVTGTVLGILIVNGIIAAGQGWIESAFGIYIPLRFLDGPQALACVGVVVAGLIAGVVPAWRAYRQSLADGLTIRV